MWCLSILLLVLIVGPARAYGSDATEYLALRGATGGTETEFNEFRIAGADESRLRIANNQGYFPWKNRCIRVSRMAAGDCFEFGGDSGFATVAPYVRLPGPPEIGFMERLAQELAGGPKT